MTDQRNDPTAGRTLYVAGDLHMGDRSDRDAFAAHLTRFEDFLGDVVESAPNGQLVLAGDIFEFWYGMRGDAFRAYSGLVARLGRLRPIFIAGNHEVALLCFGGMPMDTPLTRNITKELLVRRGGRTIRICHGHHLDRMRDPGRPFWGGTFVPWLLRQLEKRADRKLARANGASLLARASDSIARSALIHYAAACHRLRGRAPGKGSATERCIRVGDRILDAYHAEHPGEILVAGHTHSAGWWRPWYVNTGAWHVRSASYVRISLDGGVELHDWPVSAPPQTGQMTAPPARNSCRQFSRRHLPLDRCFDNIQDEKTRAFFNGLPTRLALGAETIDRGKKMGGQLLRESGTFERLILALNGSTGPTRTAAATRRS